MPRRTKHPRSKRSGEFKSGLEREVWEQLLTAGVKSSYEGVKLKYLRPASSHTYTPDFPIEQRINGKRIVIEAKGRFMPEDRKKHLWVKECNPDIEVWFVFTNSNRPIRLGSKTTYADWCKKHGFKYCDKVMPSLWLHRLKHGE